MNMRQRSDQLEILDQADIPFEDIRQNMAELDTINTLLGGHAITVSGIRKILNTTLSGRQEAAGTRPLHICEIGCGGGDNLRAIAISLGKEMGGNRLVAVRGKLAVGENRLEAVGSRLRLTGIDLKPECIRYARDRWVGDAEVEWVVSDFRDFRFAEKPDIIFSSLFCHHFKDSDVAEIFRWSAENSRLGFFMNDLQRHPLAYHSIALLTKLFSKSYLVKNDAPLSVARGFSRNELEQMLRLGIQDLNMQTDIRWKWAFRWLLTAMHAPQSKSGTEQGHGHRHESGTIK
jgi:SAM-dependent methyltransferase